MSGARSPSRFLPGFTTARSLTDDCVAVQTDIAARCEYLGLREWTILRHALAAPAPDAIAQSSTIELQASVGFRDRLAICDGLPAWCVRTLLAIGPSTRARRGVLTPVTASEVERRLLDFTARGLLVEAPRAANTGVAATPTIVLIDPGTRALQQYLASQVARASRANGVSDVLVVDARADRDVEEHRRGLCRRYCSATCRIDYIGAPERREVVEQLVGDGIPHEIASLALSSDRSGGLRNLALLLAAGPAVVMLEDACVSPIYRPCDRRRGVELFDDADPREVSFAATRAALLEGLVPSREAVWEPHAELIGRTLTSVLSCSGIERIVMGQTTGRSWGRLLTAPGRIRMTLQGCLRSDPASARLSRRALTQSITLARYGGDAGGATAVDLSEIVPPFVPRGRGADALFGNMLCRADQRAITAFLPIVAERCARRRVALRSANDTAIDVTVLADFVLAQEAVLDNQSGPSTRIERIGRALSDAADSVDLPDLAREAHLDGLSRWLRETEQAVGRSRDLPPRLADSIRRARTTVLGYESSDVRLRQFVPASPTLAGVTRELGRLGRLVQSWPAMWRARRRVGPGQLDRSGRRRWEPSERERAV